MSEDRLKELKGFIASTVLASEARVTSKLRKEITTAITASEKRMREEFVVSITSAITASETRVRRDMQAGFKRNRLEFQRVRNEVKAGFAGAGDAISTIADL